MKKILICLLVLAVVLATLCACGSTSAPAETTPAGTMPDEDGMQPAYLFDKGVWSASIDGKIDTYFVFDGMTGGHTERADGTGGVPFTCEQSGWEVVFHFGSPDDVTKATFSEGELTGTFDYGDRTVVYTFVPVADADTETFEVPAN